MFDNRETIIKKMILRDFPITEKKYLQSSLAFSKDTQDWLILDYQKMYIPCSQTENPDQLWCVAEQHTLRNFDLAWAFHLAANEIQESAKSRYREIVCSLIEKANVEGWYDTYSFESPCVNLNDDDAVLIDFIGLNQYEQIKKYPADPLGTSFYVNMIEVETQNPSCDWMMFDWKLFSLPTAIFKNELDLWVSLD